MVDIGVALAAITQSIKIAKELNEIDRDLDKADLKLKVAELTTGLSAAQITLTEAREEITQKDQEIGLLKENFQIKEDLVEHGGYQYSKRKDGSPKGLPFCPRCLTRDGFLIRLSSALGRGAKCPECKTDYPHVTHFTWEDET